MVYTFEHQTIKSYT